MSGEALCRARKWERGLEDQKERRRASPDPALLSPRCVATAGQGGATGVWALSGGGAAPPTPASLCPGHPVPGLPTGELRTVTTPPPGYGESGFRTQDSAWLPGVPRNGGSAGGGRGGKEPSLAPSIPEGTRFVGGQGRGLGWSTFPGRRPAAGQGSSPGGPYPSHTWTGALSPGNGSLPWRRAVVGPRQGLQTAPSSSSTVSSSEAYIHGRRGGQPACWMGSPAPHRHPGRAPCPHLGPAPAAPLKHTASLTPAPRSRK